jgi:hypothetical protein
MNTASLPAHTQDTIRSLTATADGGGPHAAHARAELDRLLGAAVTDKTMAHRALDPEATAVVVCAGPGRCPPRTVPESRAEAACAGPCQTCGRRTVRRASDVALDAPSDAPPDEADAAALAAAPAAPSPLPANAAHLGGVLRDLEARAPSSAHASRELCALRRSLASGLSAQGLAHPAPAAPRAAVDASAAPPATQARAVPHVRADVPAAAHEGPIQS